jgi:hypothetical protein
MIMATNINAMELERILKFTPDHHNIMLVGRHGIGKSRIVEAYFTSENKKVVTLFLGQMSDPGDIIGLPSLDQSSAKTVFRLPWWFPEDGEPIVLFLDELNRARPEILQCVMDLTLNKTIVGRKLPAGSQIISAVNEGDEYQLTDLDPALVSRFNIYHFTPTVEEWLLWAQKNNLDERVIGFIGDFPHLLDGEPGDMGLEKSPDRRAWERVSELTLDAESLDDVTTKAAAGIVGVGAALQFAQYCRTGVGFSATPFLTDFNAVSQKLMNSRAHELTALTEACFRQTETVNDERRKLYASNLALYAEWLHKHKKNEVLAHFTTLYASASYPKTKYELLMNPHDIMNYIEKFIGDIRL